MHAQRLRMIVGALRLPLRLPPAPEPPDDEPTLHELAMAAVVKFDPLEAARLERIEQRKEPEDGT